MPDENCIRQATRFLLEEQQARRPFAPIPASWAPRTVAEAYVMQEEFSTLLAATRGPAVGYKIALTAPITQQMVGFHEPVAGVIFAQTIYHAPCAVRRADYVHLGVECEIAVQLRAALPIAKAPYNREEVADAVGAVMPAVELVDDRNADYAQLGAHILSFIADNAWNAGIVLGPPVADWRAIDLAAARGTMSVNGQVVGEGYGRDVMGHPLEALTWLANMCARRGKSLSQGVVIITGSIVAPKFVRADDSVRAVVEGLGEVHVRVA